MSDSPIKYLLFSVTTAHLILGCAMPPNQMEKSAGTSRSAMHHKDQEKIIGPNDLLPVAKAGSNLPVTLRPIIAAIGQLNIGCTVTRIGQGLILTAGHCISTSPRSSSPSCRLLGVVWGNVGTNSGDSLKTSKCLKILTRRYSSQEDFAILQVENPPDAFIALETRDLDLHQPQNITMLSFPRMRPMEWSGICALHRYTQENPVSRKFFHSCDSEGGSSGAPIISLDTLSVVGVHGGASDELNYGTFVSTLDSQNILSKSIE